MALSDKLPEELIDKLSYVDVEMELFDKHALLVMDNFSLMLSTTELQQRGLSPTTHYDSDTWKSFSNHRNES